MMKISMKVAGILLLASGFMAQACTNYVKNNTPATHYLREHKDSVPGNWEELAPGQQSRPLGDKKNMPSFGIGQMQDGVVVELMVVEQQKCGLTPEESKAKTDKYLNVSDILTGMLPEDLDPLYILQTPQEMQAAQASGAVKEAPSCGCSG